MRRYTIDTLKEVIKDSTSIAQTLIKLGLKANGGNFHTIKKYISKYQIDASHFTGQACRRGKKFQPKRNIQDYLDNKFPAGSHWLKKRLINEGFFTHQCNHCHNTEWLGQPIPLELHHINGDHFDNQ